MAGVRRSESFDESVQRAGLAQNRWFERAVQALELRLAREPEAYPVVAGTPTLHIAYTRAFPPTVPPYAVVYSYTPETDTCVLLSARLAIRRDDTGEEEQA